VTTIRGTNSATSTATTTTSVTIPNDIGLTEGDTILLLAAGGTNPSWPAGWERLQWTTGVRVNAVMARKTSDGTEGGTDVTVTWSSAYDAHVHVAVIAGDADVVAYRDWYTPSVSDFNLDDTATRGLRIWWAMMRTDQNTPVCSVNRGTVYEQPSTVHAGSVLSVENPAASVGYGTFHVDQSGTGSPGIYCIVLTIDDPMEDAADAAIRADSPIGFWRMSQGGPSAFCVETGGGAHQGIYYNTPDLTPANFVPVASDYCFQGVGSDSSTNTGPYATVAEGTWDQYTTMTLEAWCNWDGNHASTIFSNDYGSSNKRRVNLSINADGTINAWVGIGTGLYSGDSVDTVTADEPAHIVWRYNGTYLHAFYQGVQVLEVAHSGSMNLASTLPWYLGRYRSGWSPFSGQLSKMAMYAGALSDERIAAHYEAGISSTSTVGTTVDLRWAVAGPVGVALDLRWAVAAATAAALDARWAVREIVAGTADLRWPVAVMAGTSSDLRWPVRELADRPVDLRWAVAAAAAAALDARWAVRELTGRPVDLRWAVQHVPRNVTVVSSALAGRSSLVQLADRRWSATLDARRLTVT